MRFLLLASLIVVIAGITIASDKAKFSAEAEGKAKLKRAEILQETSGKNAPWWAGDYYAGDGLGRNAFLAITKEAGFVYELKGCLGLYDRNLGAVTATNDQIQLQFTFENERNGLQGVASELIPVKWGERHYLIAIDEMVGFCNRVNAGLEPRKTPYGEYFLRTGDEKKSVEGSPQLPLAYESYLLRNPISANVIAVGKLSVRPTNVGFQFKDTPVTLDVGSDHGLRVGMELHVLVPARSFGSVKIKSVTKNRAEALMTQIGNGDRGPEVGWQFSTALPKGDK